MDRDTDYVDVDEWVLHPGTEYPWQPPDSSGSDLLDVVVMALAGAGSKAFTRVFMKTFDNAFYDFY